MREVLAVRDAYRGTGMGNAHTRMQCQRIDKVGIRRSGGCGGDHSKQKNGLRWADMLPIE